MTHDPFAAPRPAPSLAPQEPLEGRRPRILSHSLRYYDHHQGGAERMLHGVLKGLQARGWDVAAAVIENRPPLALVREWDGVPISVLTDAQLGDPYSWCDVALTHLDVTPMAMAWARYGRPMIHAVHNHRQLAHHHVPDDGRNFPIWNSDWLRDAVPWNGPSVVCHPPSWSNDHRTTWQKRSTAKVATLVNLLGEKGGPLFWRLAERLPDWQFIGVQGAYGMTTPGPTPHPPNVEIVPQTTDMRAVWKRTSVLLVPSWYESWSLSAAEAVASGIPVVACPTEGLRESMVSPEHGDIALFCEYDNTDEWAAALERLGKVTEWRKWSKLAKLRSAELEAQTESDLDRLDGFLRTLIAT